MRGCADKRGGRHSGRPRKDEAAVRLFSRPAADILDRVAVVLTVCSLAAALLLLLIRVLTHYLFYDEYLHVHYLWLFSAGGTPHVDFWCPFPVLGYILTLPYFRLFPESSFSILALRFLMIVLLAAQGILLALHGQHIARRWLWGLMPLVLICCIPSMGRLFSEFSIDRFAALAAVAALLLLFRRPTLLGLSFIAGLCLLSVLVTPKFAVPLFFGLSGYAAAVGARTGRPLASVSSLLLGGVGAVLTALLLYGLAGGSLLSDVRWGHLFMSKYYLTVFNEMSPVSLAKAVLQVLWQNHLLMLLLAGGIAGWVRHALSVSWTETAAGNGVLFGCLVFLSVLNSNFDQYVAPILMCLAFFVPYASKLSESEPARSYATPVLAIAVFSTVCFTLPAAATELKATPIDSRSATQNDGTWGLPAVDDLSARQQLLQLIPPDETVVAVWRYAPLYRRDLTFVTADEIQSFSLQMDRDAPERRYFETSYLREKLEERPPAMISLFQLELNYPPGWSDVIREFIVRHKGLYRELEGFSTVVYLRSDLAR